MSVEPPDTAGPSPRRAVRAPSISAPRAVVLLVLVAVGALLLGQAFGAGPGRAGGPSTTPTTASPRPSHSSTSPQPTASPDLTATITVYNSTGTPHLAGGEQSRLQQAGFTQVSAANTHPAFPKTTIEYTTAGRPTALYIQQTFYPKAVLKAAETGSLFATTDVAIVLGSDFTG